MSDASLSIPLAGRRPSLVISWTTLAVVALTAAGLALRVAAARGDLWLDEVWSYRLIEGVPSFGAIFLALPHDNNHVLNSAWLWLVGPDASSLLARLPAIVLGTLSIPVAARIGARRHPLAGVFAAAIVAVGGVFVHYGSEARGYAGLILAVLLALDSIESYLAAPRRGVLIVLAAAVALGSLSHLMMIVAVGLLGVTAIASSVASLGRSRAAGDAILRLATAMLIGLMPALACLMSSLASGPLRTGLIMPFSWQTFTIGMGQLAEVTLGLPDARAMDVGALALLLALTVAGLWLVDAPRRWFPALAVIGLPLLHVLGRLPNEEGARFHLLTALGFAVLCIEVVGHAMRAGATVRVVVLYAACAGLVAQAPYLAHLLHEGRGSLRAPVAEMGAVGAIDAMVEPASRAGETGALVRWYAAKQAIDVHAVEGGCRRDADWLLVVRKPAETSAAVPATRPGPCGDAERFALRTVYPAYGLSGFTWLVYRRTDGMPISSLSDAAHLPSPLRGGVGGGGRAVLHHQPVRAPRPPPLAPPRKGEGTLATSIRARGMFATRTGES